MKTINILIFFIFTLSSVTYGQTSQQLPQTDLNGIETKDTNKSSFKPLFVSFHYSASKEDYSFDYQEQGIRNSMLSYDEKIDSWEDIEKIIDVLKKEYGCDEVVIIYWRRVE